jgi:hypothetical protein
MPTSDVIANRQSSLISELEEESDKEHKLAKSDYLWS